MNDPDSVISGRLVPRRAASARDVDQARWNEEDAREIAVGIWLTSKTSLHTRDAYRRDIHRWFAWCDLDGVPVIAPSRSDVDNWREDMDASPATISRRLSAVSSFYLYWMIEGVVKRNPAEHATRPRVSTKPTSIRLTRQDAATLLRYVDSAPDKRIAVIVRLLAETGMRVSELCGAKVTDLSLSGGHRLLTVTRKGGEKQQLPIAPGTWARVTDYLGGREEGWLIETARTERRESDGRMDRSYVRQLLRRVSREAGLPKAVWQRMHPHVLRHSAATLLANDGVPVHDIQALLGHADLRTTQRYIDHAEDHDTSPVYKLAALFAKSKAES